MVQLAGRNEVLITAQAFAGTKELLEGTEPINAESFYNLCSVAEAAVLFSTLKLTRELEGNPVFDALLQEQAVQIAGCGVVENTISDPHMDPQLLHDLLPSMSGYICDLESLRGRGVRAIGDQLVDWMSDLCQALERDGFRRYALAVLDEPYDKLVLTDRRVIEVAYLAARNRIETERLGRPLCTSVLLAPFSAVAEKTCISRELYRRIADRLDIQMGTLEKYSGMKPIRVPPVAAMLLERCSTRESIPATILELREELAAIRTAAEEYESALAEAATLREELDLIAGLEDAWSAVAKKTRGRHTRLVFRAWDVVKSGTPLTICMTALDKLMKRGEEVYLVSRLRGFYDLWSAVMQINDYDGLIRKVFGEQIPRREVDLFSRYTDLADRELFHAGRTI